MNTTSAVAILILTAFSALARGELITSTINLNNMGQPFFTASGAAGPVADQQLTTQNGQHASSGTNTAGISYVTIPKYPGYVFVNTGAFAAWSAARLAPGGIGAAMVDTYVRRDGRWRFDAISPPLIGAGGSFQMTFRLSRSATFTTTYDTHSTQTTLQFSKTNGAIQTIAIFSNNGAGGSQTDSQLFTTTRIPFSKFGEAFDFFWRIQCFAGSSRINSEAKNSIVTELWKLAVFDANGNELTRFVDYDWHEEVGNQSGGFNTWSAASGEMVGPAATIGRAASGNLEVNYTGVLQESNDLFNWTDVVPQPEWRFELAPSPTTAKFFRSRTP